MSQIIGSLAGIAIAVIGGLIAYGLAKVLFGIRLSEEEEFQGADISIHKIGASSME